MIRVGLSGILGRHRMRPEVGRLDADGVLRGELARDAQQATLVAARQAVARLDLDRRDPFGQQRLQAPRRLRIQRLVVAAPRRLDRGADAASGTGNLLVTGALQAQLKLARPLSAVHEVRVAVDQARRNQGALQVDVLGGAARKAGGSSWDGPTHCRRSPSTTSAPGLTMRSGASSHRGAKVASCHIVVMRVVLPSS
jgi:hypothetical protein